MISTTESCGQSECFGFAVKLQTQSYPISDATFTMRLAPLRTGSRDDRPADIFRRRELSIHKLVAVPDHEVYLVDRCFLIARGLSDLHFPRSVVSAKANPQFGMAASLGCAGMMNNPRQRRQHPSNLLRLLSHAYIGSYIVQRRHGRTTRRSPRFEAVRLLKAHCTDTLHANHESQQYL